MRMTANLLNSPRKWPWLCFPVRTLLILTALIAVVLGGLSVQTNAKRIAIEVDALGGQYGVKHRGPTWIRDWFGGQRRSDPVGPFDSISSINFNETRTRFGTPDNLEDKIKFRAWINARYAARDELLKKLSGLHDLEALDLSASGCTDEGIRSLNNLPQLRVLCLSDLAITDTSLLHVTTFLSLEELDVSYSKITDLGIVDLSHLTGNLRKLGLQGTKITDSAIPSLRRMRTLEYLDLSSTDVSEKAISELQLALPSLNIQVR